MPTDKLFTGQRYEQTGLYYFNARWYDAYLNRWVQPDSIVPTATNSQSLNRYAFVRNNPVRFSDPTGHRECDDRDSCGTVRYRREAPNWAAVASNLGIKFKNWSPTVLDKVIGSFVQAALNIGSRISQSTGGTAEAAFRAVYGNITMEFCDGCVNGMGWAKGDHTIMFDSAYESETRQTRVVTHELGHIFDRMVCAANSPVGTCTDIFAETGTARSDLVGRMGTCPSGPTCLGRIGHNGPGDSDHWGFAGGSEDWQFGATDGREEVWADMFLGWTYSTWEDSSRGESRQDYMNEMMSLYLTTYFTDP